MLVTFFSIILFTSANGREFCQTSEDCTPPSKCIGNPSWKQKGFCMALNDHDNNYCSSRPANPDGPYACKNNTRCARISEVIDGGYAHSDRCVPILDSIGAECWHTSQCKQTEWPGFNLMECDASLENPVCICRWCIDGKRKDNKCNEMPKNCSHPNECPNAIGCDHGWEGSNGPKVTVSVSLISLSLFFLLGIYLN